MPQHDYAIYDVFTDTPFTGNPLAVVFAADDLDRQAMQRIAGEFNLSETVFLSSAASSHHSARANIFTPKSELPFAGHPTVGAAVAIAETQGLLVDEGEGVILVIEENVGAVRCAVSRDEVGAPFAEFDLPQLPHLLSSGVMPEMAAAALGLGPHEIGFENHVVSAWSAGVPYVTIPVKGLKEAAKAKLDAQLWLKAAPRIGDMTAAPYIYCRDTMNQDCSFHARMFAAHLGIPEDPATGSAAAAFAGTVMRFEEPVDGNTRIWIEQGIEMGRPSRIRLDLDVNGGSLERARVGGHAVPIARGTLFG